MLASLRRMPLNSTSFIVKFVLIFLVRYCFLAVTGSLMVAESLRLAAIAGAV